MIRTQVLDENLVRTYSDAGMMIRQDGTGILYCEAVDPIVCGRTYTETDEPIIDSAGDDQLLSVLTGGE